MRTLKIRTLTAIVFGIIMIAGIFISVKTAIILFGIICLICSFEYTKIVRRNLKDAMYNTTFVAGVVLYALAFMDDLNAYYELILYLNCGFFLLFILGMLSNKTIFSQAQISPVYNLIYIGMPFYLLHIKFFQSTYDPWLLMSIFICIWLSDTGAYLVGSKFGKHSLFKRVSPNKTWEGVFGGLALTIIGVYLLHMFKVYTNFNILNWISIAIIIVIIGILGDLFESSIKRTFEIKDSGNIMPGHGGFLDRFDSFIFVIPFICLYLEIIA